ncbi:MAG: response regulator [Chloroflexi bacterium]|nr:MAG: response regulator [Chloroflexota bacterium]
MCKILLIEDNAMLQDILSERLTIRNFEVLIASDGQSGINQAIQEQPDLILMDMSLPVIDGWEASHLLKEQGNTQHIPIIALTAHALSGDREKSLGAGCDEFETKPVNFSRLLTKIVALLEQNNGRFDK